MSYYQIGLADRAAGKPRTQAVQEGLAATAQALRLAPDWPRALAVQGALQSLAASAERNTEARSSSLRRAAESLQQAFAGNPLLKNVYGAVLAEVEERGATR